METVVLDSVVSALGKVFASSAVEFTAAKMKNWLDHVREEVPGEFSIPSDEILEAATKHIKHGYDPVGFEMSSRNLARWFEIPEEEFELTPKEQLEPEVLIRHIMLEQQFGTWLAEWGYEVSTGKEMEGIDDIEFIPDVYGRLSTLHGTFEVVCCLLCDNPPSIYRARALFETFESVARDRSSFAECDIFAMITPFKFGKGARSSISLQNIEEKYTVLELEREDIYRLSRAECRDDRFNYLSELVENARRESGTNSPYK